MVLVRCGQRILVICSIGLSLTRLRRWCNTTHLYLVRGVRNLRMPVHSKYKTTDSSAERERVPLRWNTASSFHSFECVATTPALGVNGELRSRIEGYSKRCTRAPNWCHVSFEHFEHASSSCSRSAGYDARLNIRLILKPGMVEEIP